jgi:anti-anti-sigma regulatory factor
LPEPVHKDDRVLVALHEGKALVRVAGRGSFKVSTALKQFGEAAMAAGCSTAAVDLAACTGMDSTFMGVLAGIATRLKRNPTGELIMLNLSPRTLHLVTTLGLHLIARPYAPGEEPEEFQHLMDEAGGMTPLEATNGNSLRTTRTMLEAHQNLVDVLPENRPRFKDVLAFLREDLQKKSDPPPTGNGSA